MAEQINKLEQMSFDLYSELSELCATRLAEMYKESQDHNKIRDMILAASKAYFSEVILNLAQDPIDLLNQTYGEMRSALISGKKLRDKQMKVNSNATIN